MTGSGSAAGVDITTWAERPDRSGFVGLDPWPTFMQQDPTGALFYGRLDDFAEYVLLARDAADGTVVARACSIPFHWGGAALPDDGWDGVIRAGVATLVPGAAPPDAVSALEVGIAHSRRGTGLSAVMLDALRANAARLGYDELVAPVRPNGKADVRRPMAEHVAAVRDDGLPLDPWLRVHVRAGGVIERVAPWSMVMTGSPAQWREWTGLPFDAAGPVEVPGALAPVWCDPMQDVAVYVEPNVWVRHRTDALTTSGAGHAR